MDPSAIVGNLDGIALLAVVVWLIYRQRNTDAASMLEKERARITTLETRLDALETELRTRNRLLRRAVDYIAHLLGWIALHAPNATPQPDPLPDDLTDI